MTNRKWYLARCEENNRMISIWFCILIQLSLCCIILNITLDWLSWSINYALINSLIEKLYRTFRIVTFDITVYVHYCILRYPIYIYNIMRNTVQHPISRKLYLSGGRFIWIFFILISSYASQYLKRISKTPHKNIPINYPA